MAKLQWNRVTWYSKLIALVIFIVFPFIGFHWGVQYGQTLQLANQGSSVSNSGGENQSASEYYTNPKEWQTESNDAGGFSIAYPIDFSTQSNSSQKPTTDWSLLSNGESGSQFFTLTIPKAFEPQTNFSEATLAVGASRTTSALKNCLTSGVMANPGDATSTANINGVSFVVYHFTGAGAGNYYETTSYRTIHAGQCYSIDYMIHSSQIANYPAEYHLHQYNDGLVNGVLSRIVGTFMFH